MPISPKIRPLREEERTLAHTTAIQWVAGPVPKPEDFKTTVVSKYPSWAITPILVFCVIVLIAAFTPSSVRLFLAGSTEFCLSYEKFLSTPETEEVSSVDLSTFGPFPVSICDVVGWSTIILAEVGLLVFLLSLAILDQGHKKFTVYGVTLDVTSSILWAGALTSMVIAIVGNAHVGQPWNHGGTIFAYLETFVPPFLVMGVGYVLKEIFLYSIRSAYEGTLAYRQKIAEREERLRNPESDHRWLRTYSRSLREAIRAANSRSRNELDELTDDDWKLLVRDEMKALLWEVSPEEPVTQEEILVSTNTPLLAEIREGDRITQNDDGTFTAFSSAQGSIIGTKYARRHYAQNALNNVNRAHLRRLSNEEHSLDDQTGSSYIAST